jgi:hypothetical protein
MAGRLRLLGMELDRHYPLLAHRDNVFAAKTGRNRGLAGPAVRLDLVAIDPQQSSSELVVRRTIPWPNLIAAARTIVTFHLRFSELRMGRLAGVLLTTILTASVSPAIPSDWLPLTKSQITNLTVGSANTESLKIELVDEQTKVKKTRSLAVDESVWVATNATLAMGMVMAGKDENIHTIRIPVFTLGLSANRDKADRVFRLLSDLFINIFPDWPEARGWPMSSLKEAWNINPLVTKKMPTDPNDQIIKKNLGGITIATFGVPPNIVVYTITARDGCIPDVKRGNPFDRLIC